MVDLGNLHEFTLARCVVQWSANPTVVMLHYNKKQKVFSEKQKGFRDGLSYSTSEKVNKQGKMHYPTSVQSHP